MVKFYLDKELFSEEYKELGINYATFWAVYRSKENGNEIIDFAEPISDSDIPEIVDTFLRMKRKHFTISCDTSGLINTLKGFEKYGVFFKNITETNSHHRDAKTGKRKKKPALLMELR